MKQYSQTKRYPFAKAHVSGITEARHDGCKRKWLDVADIVLEHSVDRFGFEQRSPIERPTLPPNLRLLYVFCYDTLYLL